MKKFISTIMLAFVAMLVSAQDNPERMFVVEKNGAYKGFLVERVDSVFFMEINDDVYVDMTFHSIDNTDPLDPKVTVSFKRSTGCNAFRFCVVPKPKADVMKTDGDIARFFDVLHTPMMYQDYDHALMTGFEFEFVPGAEYSVLAIAYDSYDIACRSARVDFKVPDVQILGNPSVDWEITEVTTESATVKMQANKDCTGYYICLFNEGEAQSKFDQFAPMFGFACIGDMIKAWSGELHRGEYTNKWDFLVPNTKYELYIQPLDKNYNYGEPVIANILTKNIGGEGVAEMTIEIGEFGGDATGGYWQVVNYIPNDQCSAHRDMLLKKEAFINGTWTEKSFIEYMMNDKDPDNPENPYWDCYGVDNAQWNAEPNTEYIAYSMAKNIKGEWGPIVKKEFKTPSAKSSVRPIRSYVGKRVNADRNIRTLGGTVIKKNLMLTE